MRLSRDIVNTAPIEEFSRLEKDQAIHSARFILEDIPMEPLAEITGLPLGVIANAFKNIFEGGLEFRKGRLKRE